MVYVFSHQLLKFYLVIPAFYKMTISHPALAVLHYGTSGLLCWEPNPINHSQFSVLTNIKSLFPVGCCNMQNKIISSTPWIFKFCVLFHSKKLLNTPDLIQFKSFGDRVPAFGTRRKRDTLTYSIEKAGAAIFLTLSLLQSVPKYLCPKCVGATGWTSVVKMVISGNSWIIDLAPGGRKVKMGLVKYPVLLQTFNTTLKGQSDSNSVRKRQMHSECRCKMDWNMHKLFILNANVHHAMLGNLPETGEC